MHATIQGVDMKRREFLAGAAVAAAGLIRPMTARAAQQARQAVLDRISIMSLNFQNILKVPDTNPSPDRTLELFDFPQMLADTYGMHKIEFQHYHLRVARGRVPQGVARPHREGEVTRDADQPRVQRPEHLGVRACATACSRST